MDTYLLKPKFIILTAAVVLPALIVALWLLFPRTTAHAINERIVTIYHDNQEQIVATNAETVGEVLDRAHIVLGEHDAVEPSRSTKLVAANYNVNVYRARPVTVVDGNQRYRIMTPHSSAKKIAEAAGLKAYDEDIFELTRIDDFLEGGGAGLKLAIKRSTPVKAILYDEPVDMRSQAKTVKEFLEEKAIALKPGDKLWPTLETPIAAEMAIAIYRDGSQAVKEEELPFEVEKIHDNDHEVGYKEVKEKGSAGKRFVIYQIETKNGKEERKEIQSILISHPKKQVEVVGAKTKGFDGDFATALAKLRSCEGSYTSVNPIGYYGAYQFNVTTWRGAAPEGFKDVRPDQAPPAIQDQAARALYERRGWQPWPACSRKFGLQDVYR